MAARARAIFAVTAIKKLLSAGVIGVALVAGCASEPDSDLADGECSGNPDCGAGQVCIEGVCEEVCQSDTQCGEEQACIEGVCAPCDACRDIPELTAIDGTGTPNEAGGAHADHHLRRRIVLKGANLQGSEVKLGGDGRVLEICASNPNRLEVELPEDVAEGDYTLTVTNQAGSCGADVTILEGERGPPGEYNAGENIVIENGEISATFARYEDVEARYAMAQANHQNLTRNTGFSEGTTTYGVPRHFELWKGDVSALDAGEASVQVVQAASAQTGRVTPNWLKISVPTDSTLAKFGLQQTIFRSDALPPNMAGETVTASIWVKQTSGSAPARIGLQDSQTSITWQDAEPGEQWQQVVLQHTVSQTPDYLKVILEQDRENEEAVTYGFNGLMVSHGEQTPVWRPHRLDRARGGETWSGHQLRRQAYSFVATQAGDNMPTVTSGGQPEPHKYDTLLNTQGGLYDTASGLISIPVAGLWAFSANYVVFRNDESSKTQHVRVTCGETTIPLGRIQWPTDTIDNADHRYMGGTAYVSLDADTECHFHHLGAHPYTIRGANHSSISAALIHPSW